MPGRRWALSFINSNVSNLFLFCALDLNARMPYVMKLKIEDHKKCVAERKCPTIAPALSNVRCQGGKADEYECNNVDLLSFVPISQLGCGGDLNDIWGWTDPVTNREYAIVGCYDGTSFVDVTVPNEPQVLGFLPTHTFGSNWRDIKVGSYLCVHACRVVAAAI